MLQNDIVNRKTYIIDDLETKHYLYLYQGKKTEQLKLYWIIFLLITRFLDFIVTIDTTSQGRTSHYLVIILSSISFVL